MCGGSFLAETKLGAFYMAIWVANNISSFFVNSVPDAMTGVNNYTKGSECWLAGSGAVAARKRAIVAWERI